MTLLLVLGLAATCWAQINQNSGTSSGLTKTGNGNDPDTKIFQLPFVDENTSNLLWGGALGAGATLVGQELLGNNCGGFGRRRRQAQDPNDTNKKIFGLFGGNNCNNPCGRKRRQAEGVDTGEKVDTKFFGNLFGGGSNNNCGYNGGYRPPQGYNNNYNTGYNNNNPGYNNNQGYNRVCQCSNISKTDNYGREEARCKTADHTGRRWCYSTTNSNCNDAQASSRYPRNPWSYQACSGGGSFGRNG